MSTPSTRCLFVSLGLCLALETGLGRAAPEKVPPDKVIHPLMNGVPVDVYTTIIVEFTPCPDNPGEKPR